MSPIGGHTLDSHPRPGVAYVPITDAPVLRYALVWRTAGESALIRDRAQAAAEEVRALGHPGPMVTPRPGDRG